MRGSYRLTGVVLIGAVLAAWSTSAATLAATRPDLRVTSVGDPPATTAPGGQFSATDTTMNAGPGKAAKSTTRYYLSIDAKRGTTDVRLKGARSVPALGKGKTSSGSVEVTVPGPTAAGTYHLLACADDLKRVTESKEGNDCRASNGTVTIAPPLTVIGAAATAATTVVVSFDATLDAGSVLADGSQFVFDHGLTASSAAVDGETVTVTTSVQSQRQPYGLTVADTVHSSGGASLAADHDTADFAGFVPLATLGLSEVAPDVSGGQDLVELTVLSAGTMKGITLVEDPSDSAVTLATLPDVTVAVADIVVVHLKPPAGVTTETVSKSDCTSACYAAAWDVAGGSSDVSYTAQVLAVLDPTGNIEDAAPFVRPSESTPPSGFPAALQAIQAVDQWSPADCGGAPCTYDTTPTAIDVSIDWTGVGTTTFGKTVGRIHGIDTNIAGDWTVSTGTMGFPNQ